MAPHPKGGLVITKLFALFISLFLGFIYRAIKDKILLNKNKRALINYFIFIIFYIFISIVYRTFYLFNFNNYIINLLRQKLFILTNLWLTRTTNKVFLLYLFFIFVFIFSSPFLEKGLFKSSFVYREGWCPFGVCFFYK